MSNKVRNIFFLLGIIAIVVMVFTLDVSLVEVWSCVCAARGWIFAVMSIWVFLYFMNALTWKTILKESGDVNLSFMFLYKLTISGFALNYATPAGLMGGEPYKIMELTPYVGRNRAASSVLLFSMMHIYSHFWYWFVISVLGMICITLNATLLFILLSMSLFSLLGIYLFLHGYKSGVVIKVLNVFAVFPLVGGWVKKILNTHKSEIEKVDEQIRSFHNQNKRSFYLSFSLEFVGRVLQAFEIFFILKAFGSDCSFLQLFFLATFIIALTSLIANVLFFMPLQLGGREGGFMLSVLQLGLSSSLGMFISVICRVREIIWTTIGMLLIKVANKPKEREVTV
jgi:uncharacterized membrane protein YbhN (UPF0104 family)